MISQAIAQYLQEQDIDPASLSAQTGIGVADIRHALDGKRNFSIEEYVALCAALKVSHQFFFDRAKAVNTHAQAANNQSV